MITLTFGTLKGGVGKSSTLFNIAGILSENNKVLVIDLDPQSNTTNNFNIDISLDKNNMKNVFEEELDPEKIVIKNVISELPNIDLLPSSIFLTSTEMRLISQAGRENILKNYFHDNQDFFNQYDYILLDTNPSMSVINQNAFVVSDHILLVSDVSINSLNGAELFIALWNDIQSRLRLTNNISGFIINMFDKRIKLSGEFLDFCKSNEQVRDLLFNTYIPTNVKLKECELDAKPINVFDEKCMGYNAYKKLITEMSERGIL